MSDDGDDFNRPLTERDLVGILRYALDGRAFAQYGIRVESLDWAQGRQAGATATLVATLRRYQTTEMFEITIRRKR